MSDEKVSEYDHGSSLSLVGSIETICGLLAGFTFTGTIVVLTGIEEPITLLAQVVLFILWSAMGMFTVALWELHFMNLLVCLQSPKLIIPNYPNRWRVINTLIVAGSFLEMFSINLLFLLNNLRLLFALSTCIDVFSFVFMNFYRFKPLKEKMEEDMEKRRVSKEK